MTLTATTKKRPPAYHKKVSGSHHRRSKTYNKTYWPYLPLLAVVIAGALFNTALNARHSVLGYATGMTAGQLLSDTNGQREANGESDLGMNSQLNNAAQAKASDMAARDYWSHNTPDGQTPWSFMTAAGYNYELAGENLAYGFTSAADTITGWMNSPEHRANILNAGYKDVGFGIIDIQNYQGTGPETLVVAMYGSPAASAPVAAVSTQPTASGTSQTTGSGGGSSQSAASSPSAAAEQPTPALTTQQTEVVTPKAAAAAQQSTQQKQISRAQLLTAGKAPWSMFVVSVLGTCALLAFLLRHGFAWHKIFVRGEKFLLHHPWLDTGLVAVVMLSIALIHQTGVIR